MWILLNNDFHDDPDDADAADAADGQDDADDPDDTTWELLEWFPLTQQSKWGWKAKGKVGPEPLPCISSPPSPQFSLYFQICPYISMYFQSSSIAWFSLYNHPYPNIPMYFHLFSLYNQLYPNIPMYFHLHLVILIVVSDMLRNELNSLHCILHLNIFLNEGLNSLSH